MGEIYEVITGRVANPAAFTALTPNGGDTFAVRAYGGQSLPLLEGLWTQQAAAGFVRLRSSRLHDPTRGITLAAPAATIQNLLPDETEQELDETDTLVFELQGGAAETDAAAMLVSYNGIASGTAKLAMWEQVAPLIVNYIGHQVDTAGPVATGDWSAGTPFNNLSGLLHANTWYAILGYQLDTASLAVAVRGPDTGNFRVGGPGPLTPIETRDWFVRQSRVTKRPRIPIINSQNAAGTTSNVAKVGAGGTVNVTWIMAELKAWQG